MNKKQIASGCAHLHLVQVISVFDSPIRHSRIRDKPEVRFGSDGMHLCNGDDY